MKIENFGNSEQNKLEFPKYMMTIYIYQKSFNVIKQYNVSCVSKSLSQYNLLRCFKEKVEIKLFEKWKKVENINEALIRQKILNNLQVVCQLHQKKVTQL